MLNHDGCGVVVQDLRGTPPNASRNAWWHASRVSAFSPLRTVFEPTVWLLADHHKCRWHGECRRIIDNVRCSRGAAALLVQLAPSAQQIRVDSGFERQSGH
jgi:hypothetical protein